MWLTSIFAEGATKIEMCTNTDFWFYLAFR
jgi:hypothetical protein